MKIEIAYSYQNKSLVYFLRSTIFLGTVSLHFPKMVYLFSIMQHLKVTNH